MWTLCICRREYRPHKGPEHIDVSITEISYPVQDEAVRQAYLIAREDSRDPMGDKGTIPVSLTGYYAFNTYWGSVEITVRTQKDGEGVVHPVC